MTKRSLHHFAKDAQGAIAPLYALSLFALVGIGGIAFDYGRIAAMDTELQGAADQAALAAATQLAKVSGSKANAVTAAEEYFASHGYNKTLFANDGDTDATKVGVVTVEFYSSRADAEAETNAFDAASTSNGEEDADANFVRVVVKQRTAEFALTPVVGALRGSLDAAATAGLGSSVCKVPPIMICHPDPSTSIDWDDMAGVGVQATGHNPGNSGGKDGAAGSGANGGGTTWSPGNFGFLQINDPGDNASRNAALLKALAYVNPPFDCTPVGDNQVSTGNPQGLYDAINTRFDIYDFGSNGGSILAPCISGICPPAPNAIKDFTKANANTNGNACKIHSQGWKLPANTFEFKPTNTNGTGNSAIFNANTARTVTMGLPRDNCHYTSYIDTDGLCPGGTGRFGDALWGRADYFKTNHTVSGSVVYPPAIDGRNWSEYTRYETYLWEIEQNNMPSGTSQRGRRVCSSVAGTAERRVMTVAVVTNCNDLHGTSIPVDIDAWVDVFLVEPSTDAGNGSAPRWNSAKDSIYMEIIGPSKTAGGNSYGVQTVRRDVPYLVR